MTEREAFLADIIANPTDDVPRLIFADWLEERGEPERANFIRVQCELAKDEKQKCAHRWVIDLPVEINSKVYLLPANTNCGLCRWCLLKKREEELQVKNVLNWVQKDFPWLVKDWTLTNTHWFICGEKFRRGFVAEATMSCADWLRYGERLSQETPLEKVTLTHLNVGAIRLNGDVLACSVYPHPNIAMLGQPVSLNYRRGELWYQTGEDGSPNVVLIRVDPKNVTLAWGNNPTIESRLCDYFAVQRINERLDKQDAVLNDLLELTRRDTFSMPSDRA